MRIIWIALLFGFILALILTALGNGNFKRTKRTPETEYSFRPPDNSRILRHDRTHYYPRPIVQRTPWPTHIRPPPLTGRPSRPFFERSQRTKEENTKFLVENWRKSIVGLVRMAEENLTSAEKTHLAVRRDYRTAIELALTSVENISRALIHCYGEKPELGSGQEEALKLLSRRFQGEEKTEFEKAIATMSCIAHEKMSFPYRAKYKSAYNLQIRLLEEMKTKKILKSASNVVSLFKRIITHHFTTEIPGLQDEAYVWRSFSTGYET